jgi:hypothetical protein
MGASGWILGRRRWQQIDTDDPRKVLALDVFHTVKAVPVVSRTLGLFGNGASRNVQPRNGNSNTEEMPDRGKE